MSGLSAAIPTESHVCSTSERATGTERHSGIQTKVEIAVFILSQTSEVPAVYIHLLSKLPRRTWDLNSSERDRPGVGVPVIPRAHRLDASGIVAGPPPTSPPCAPPDWLSYSTSPSTSPCTGPAPKPMPPLPNPPPPQQIRPILAHGRRRRQPHGAVGAHRRQRHLAHRRPRAARAVGEDGHAVTVGPRVRHDRRNVRAPRERHRARGALVRDRERRRVFDDERSGPPASGICRNRSEPGLIGRA